MIRISGSDPASGLASAKAREKKRKSRTSGSGGGTDTVRVADAASLREKVQIMLADMPELRMDRIEEIRDALESGSYEIDSRKVAARIITNAVAERLW